MSYDINLTDPVTHKTIELDFDHDMRGGTYRVCGTNELHLNITYNYAEHFYAVVDNKLGIRGLYGKTGAESIAILTEAISKLNDDVDDNYWVSTEGNAKRSLQQLLAMAQLRPDGIWDGD